MFELDKAALEALGAEITTREIKQQPSIWRETYQMYLDRQEKIKGFIGALLESYGRLEVIFTGAGSSAYVKQTITNYLRINTIDIKSIIIAIIFIITIIPCIDALSQ